MISRELRELWRLALPLVVGHAGNQLMSFVDTAMVGRLGATSIAGVGIGNALYFVCTLFGLGCVMGMEAPVAQAIGAGEHARARRTLSEGLRVAVIIGVPLTIGVGLLSLAVERFGISAETAVEVRHYVLGRLPNVIPFLVFAACRSFLQAQTVTRPIIVAMVVANVINLVGNAVLIYGDASLGWVGLPAIGLPALGVFGSGLASSLASVVSVVILMGAIRALAPEGAAGVTTPHDPALRRTILRLGVPLGLQILAEVGLFALAGVLAGRMSGLSAAAHQVAITLASFSFTVTIGIGAATSVRVGYHVGREDTPAARRAGFLGLGSAAAFMLCSAAFFVSFPSALARLLTNQPAVVAAAVPLVMVAAAFALSDGIQAVGSGALRGAGDTRAPLYAMIAGYYAVGLPVAIWLGFGRGWGAVGLWWGMSAGLTAVALSLVARFAVLSSRPISRV